MSATVSPWTAPVVDMLPTPPVETSEKKLPIVLVGPDEIEVDASAEIGSSNWISNAHPTESIRRTKTPKNTKLAISQCILIDFGEVSVEIGEILQLF